MGKKEKREKVESNGDFGNGVTESNDKHPKKKRKNRDKVKEQHNDGVSLPTETPTITLALPGSIIDNAQSHELATRVMFFPLSFLPLKIAFLLKFWSKIMFLD